MTAGIQWREEGGSPGVRHGSGTGLTAPDLVPPSYPHIPVCFS